VIKTVVEDYFHHNRLDRWQDREKTQIAVQQYEFYFKEKCHCGQV
jgi:hypothetical protein